MRNEIIAAIKHGRITCWVGDQPRLILDNPTTAAEANQQFRVRFDLACRRLARIEDAVENGEIADTRVVREKAYIEACDKFAEAIIECIQSRFGCYIAADLGRSIYEIAEKLKQEAEV